MIRLLFCCFRSSFPLFAALALLWGNASPALASHNDPTNGDCPPVQVTCGDPINISTGNVFAEYTDYETAGPNQLRFTRSYNSNAGIVGLLGNWRSTFDKTLLL